MKISNLKKTMHQFGRDTYEKGGNIELSGTSYFYSINDTTLNGVTYDVAEGFIINYYNLLNGIV